MMKKLLNIIVFAILLSGGLLAQVNRTAAMGNLSYSVSDEDATFDPFVFGENPAYLWISRQKARLELTQFNFADYGDYRRKYASERTTNIGANVLGIQPLGKNGTFQGRAVYVYEKRSNVYRTLKYNTYAGEAFYFTDTTSGDVVYNGPLFEFSHSLPVSEKLSLGGVFGYGLLNGLKKVYTYGETVYRNVYGKVGATYSVSPELQLGLHYEIFDIQERIVASDVNLFTVITYQYRGDTHRIELSGSKQKYKVSKHGDQIGGQIYYVPNDKMEIGLVSFYGTSDTRSIFPITGVEKEDGYSWFRNYSLQLRARYKLTPTILLAVKSDFNDNYSWSKNSKTDFLLWEWDVTSASVGIGASFSGIIPDMVLGFEGEFNNVQSDSSKYIDHVFNNISSSDYVLRGGLEYEISNYLALRTGFEYLTFEHDFIYGGDNVEWQKITFGLGIKVTDSFNVNLWGNYGNRGDDVRKREFWDARITFRFNKF